MSAIKTGSFRMDHNLFRQLIGIPEDVNISNVYMQMDGMLVFRVFGEGLPEPTDYAPENRYQDWLDPLVTRQDDKLTWEWRKPE